MSSKWARIIPASWVAPVRTGSAGSETGNRSVKNQAGNFHQTNVQDMYHFQRQAGAFAAKLH